MSNKKIVLCLPTFFLPQDKRSSGGTISNFSLVKELSKHSQLEIISPIVSSELLEAGLRNVSVITRTGLEGKSIISKIKKKIWLKNEILRRSNDTNILVVISTNGTSSFVDTVFPGKNIILTRAFEDFLAYEVNGENFREKIRKKILMKLIGRKIKDAYSNALMIITNSKFMKSEISDYFGLNQNKIFVLYPPIDFPDTKYRPLPIEGKVRIGIINPKKIKGEGIFVALAKEFKNIDFIYFSRDDREYGIQNIIYKGWGDNPSKLFDSFDVLIAPSLWDEPFGRVAVEGIRSGIPVLVSNHGGITETVTKDFIVKGDTVFEWKRKISWLLDNPTDVKLAWQLTKEHTEIFVSKRHDEMVQKLLSNYIKIKT